MRKIIITSLILSFFSINIAGGQFFSGGGINVFISPNPPKPNQEVEISIENFSTDLNRATISWYIDGVLQRQGRGIKSIVMNSGSVGSRKVIDITIDGSSGVITKKIIVAPADIKIFEQSSSYTPPFYKGKALTSPESEVLLIASPNFVSRNGSAVPEGSIVFTWKRNGKVLGSDSGLGKSTLMVKAPRIQGEIIDIEVEGVSTSEGIVASSKHELRAFNQEIIFYEDNPLTGVNLNKAIGQNFDLNKQELTVVAYPYFFGVDDLRDSSLIYRWAINNNAVSPTGGTPNIITLRKPDDEGLSNISLSVENEDKIFESVRKTFRVIFGDIRENIFNF